MNNMESGLGELIYIQHRFWVSATEPYEKVIVRKWTKEEMDNHDPNTPIFEIDEYTGRHGIKELIYGKLVCLEIQIREYKGIKYPRFVSYE